MAKWGSAGALGLGTEAATDRLLGAVTIEAATDIPAEVRNHLGEPMTFWACGH
jgi:hypothetical protein